jgi:pimeloyl-ACP methyl ester carboxylesterase
MQPAAFARLIKSTTDRIILRASGAGLGTLGIALPGAADRLAIELFARPRQGLRPVAPEALGLAAHRFEVMAPKSRLAPRRRTVESSSLAVWDWGEGPTVLLVHGWNGNAAQLSPFVAPLVRAGYYVVAFDQPAHGSSPGRRATVADFAEAVLAVGRRVGPVHAIVGHSLGGTAAALALGFGLEAERLVLLAPPADLPHFGRSFASGLRLSHARTAGFMAELSREVGGDLGALDLRRLAPSMRSRLLVLHDRDDREVPFAHGADIANAWPEARLEALSGLGHRRLLRDPEVIAASIAFIQGRQDRLKLPELAGDRPPAAGRAVASAACAARRRAPEW